MFLTRWLGGTLPGIPYLALLTVLAGGMWFGLVGGALEGLYAALLLGPLIGGLEVVPPQSAHGTWWGPPLFFVLLGLASAAATARLRRRLEMERTHRNELSVVHGRTLMTFANLVAHRDQPTAYHCERVAENARRLGKLYGLEGDELNALYWAGMLHDLGKIATPASILLKEGKLTSDEYDVVKQHADLGADVLLDISPRFQHIADGVRTHHERWDGSGYPNRLAGESIPLYGRLLAIVDVFEAMTAPRPYRAPFTPNDVMQHLHSKAGVEFDPDMVRLFAQLYRRHLVLTHGDGRPAPADLSTGIFSTTFWNSQARPADDPMNFCTVIPARGEHQETSPPNVCPSDFLGDD